MADKKATSFLQKLKEKAQQKNYGSEAVVTAAAMHVENCPNCGAGRARQDGITHCAYCNFEFITTTLTDGIYLNKDYNSKK